MRNLTELINEYAVSPSIKLTNALAEAYLAEKQYSASISFYIKLYEMVSDNDYKIKYHASMMIGYLYYLEGNRSLGSLQYFRLAKSEMPDRPEAYYMISKVLSTQLLTNKLESYHWIEVFENSKIGLLYYLANTHPTSTNLYFDPSDLAMIYGLSLLKLNKLTECKEFLLNLPFNLSESHLDDHIYLCNELRLRNPYNYYDSSKLTNLKIYFNEADKILESNAQVMQDMFVLTALDGKSKGTYLEIGSAEPNYNNNTYLLESEFNWTGISFDIDPIKVEQFQSMRSNPVICYDAIKYDYSKLYNHYKSKVIDYLSMDIDPSELSLDCLKRILWNGYEFKVITIEHDQYRFGNEIRDRQRSYLKSKGYILIGEDIKYDTTHSFEDWWINPKWFKESKIDLLKSIFNNSNGIISKIFYK